MLTILDLSLVYLSLNFKLHQVLMTAGNANASLLSFTGDSQIHNVTPESN